MSRAFLVALLLPAAASAAGWEGFYAGAQGGYAHARSTWATSAFLIASNNDEKIEHQASGGAFGGQFGYWSRRSPQVLIGAEATLLYAKLEERGPSPLPQAPNRERITRIKTPASLVAQAGYQSADWLTYGKAGLAAARIELEANNNNPGGITMSWSGLAYGLTAGAGVSRALGRNLSAGIEYDFLWLRMRDRSGNNSGNIYVTAADFDSRINLLALRLNYSF